MYQFFISLYCWIIFYYMDIPYQFLSSQAVESLLLYKQSYKQWLGSTLVHKCLFNPCYSWKYIINCIIAQFSRSIINYHSDICVNENTWNEVPLYLSQLLKIFFCNLWEEEVIATLKAWTPQDITVFSDPTQLKTTCKTARIQSCSLWPLALLAGPFISSPISEIQFFLYSLPLPLPSNKQDLLYLLTNYTLILN